MMMHEFTERTGFEPMAEEYQEIEEAYYRFDGNKDEFCKSFVESGGVTEIYKARAAKIEQLRSQLLEMDRSLRQSADQYEVKIKKLEADLEREQEWNPYEDTHNVSQTDYDTLANDCTTRELTDEEAADMIASEFGFDRSKIVIVHEVITYEINRHRQLRKTGTTPRKALFNAWDWNYIVFNIKGNVTMGWEMHNGELQQYWA